MSYKYLALPAQEGLQLHLGKWVGLSTILALPVNLWTFVSLYSRAPGPSSSENSLRSGNRRRHRSGSPPRNSGTDPVGEQRSIQRSGFKPRRSSRLFSLETRPSVTSDQGLSVAYLGFFLGGARFKIEPTEILLQTYIKRKFPNPLLHIFKFSR